LVNLTTELEAVNYFLVSIGEQPINSLIETRSTNAQLALTLLQQVSRQVQSEGLNCNSENNYMFAKNLEDKVIIPKNVLSLSPSESYREIITRGRKLYDKDNHTYDFEEGVECDVVWLLEFEELPQVVREYITIKGARVFQTKVLGSVDLHRLSVQDEREAYYRLVAEEIDTTNNNILMNPEIMGSVRR